MTPEHELAHYFRMKQFSMGQRFVRAKVISSLASRGLASDKVEAMVERWEAEGLIRKHGDHTISLTSAAYPRYLS